MATALQVRNAYQLMVRVEPTDVGLSISFADGLDSLVPWEDIGVKAESDVDSIEFDNPWEVIISTKLGKVEELPWDFVRYLGDERYRDHVAHMEDQSRQSFADRLRTLRVQSGKSLEEVASLSGYDEDTIARLESAGQELELDTLDRLAAALGCSIQALMTEDWEEYTPNVDKT